MKNCFVSLCVADTKPQKQPLSFPSSSLNPERVALTLAVELQEPLLVLSQLGPTRHLIDLPLQDGDFAVPPSLKADERVKPGEAWRPGV